ncbi:MAG: sigma-54-dependent transcriptional regulator [Thermoanaerobaculia bacterium]
MSRVLIVEDQPAVANALRLLLELHEIESTTARNAESAMRIVRRGDVDLVVQDMNFTPGATSGEEGTALFRRLRQEDPNLPVLVLTAWTSLETAVQLVKEGASDYLAKPWDDTRLVSTVRSLLDVRSLATAPQAMERHRIQGDLCGLVFESNAMRSVVSLALQVAKSDVPVLITGPNGAGKEKIAEIIHANSHRRGAPLVKVNAGALPDELLESELFGAEAGAYTGASRLRIGRFETAHQGTLFLDEIGNLSAAGQMKVLRVLQSGEFERLGSSETRRADVRVIAATNSDLRDAMSHGEFRRDLYFRLNVIELAVPALSRRREDILPLAEHFLSGARATPPAKSLSNAAREALLTYDWPGNVRELQNRITRATLIAEGATIEPGDLGFEDMGGAHGGSESIERREIEMALLNSAGSVSRAAASLGLSRQAFYRRMEKLGVVLERRPKA